MPRHTSALRFLLALLLLALVLGSGLLYGFSLESARAWPELAHLRLPVYLAALVGCVPLVVAIRSVVDFLGLVDGGAAFSARTVEVLRRFRLSVGAFAGCLGLGSMVFWVATDLMHLTLVFLWFVAEVAALTVCAMAALLERLLARALAQDTALTV
jgi:hypothetical protein